MMAAILLLSFSAKRAQLTNGSTTTRSIVFSRRVSSTSAHVIGVVGRRLDWRYFTTSGELDHLLTSQTFRCLGATSASDWAAGFALRATRSGWGCGDKGPAR